MWPHRYLSAEEFALCYLLRAADEIAITGGATSGSSKYERDLLQAFASEVTRDGGGVFEDKNLLSRQLSARDPRARNIRQCMEQAVRNAVASISEIVSQASRSNLEKVSGTIDMTLGAMKLSLTPLVLYIQVSCMDIHRNGAGSRLYQKLIEITPGSKKSSHWTSLLDTAGSEAMERRR